MENIPYHLYFVEKTTMVYLLEMGWGSCSWKYKNNPRTCCWRHSLHCGLCTHTHFGIFRSWFQGCSWLSSEGAWGLCSLQPGLPRAWVTFLSPKGAPQSPCSVQPFPAVFWDYLLSIVVCVDWCFQSSGVSLWNGNDNRGWLHSFHKGEIRCCSVSSMSLYRSYSEKVHALTKGMG